MTRTRLTSLLAVVLAAALALPVPAVAQEGPPREMTVADVTTAHVSLDGTLVTFTGEAIGEALGSHADWKWVNVLGEAVAVGVVVPTEWVERIDRFGDYHSNGTRVQVVGTLNIACDEHGGDLDVHADSFEVVEKGSDREHDIPTGRLAMAVVLGIVAVGLAGVYSYLKRRTL